MNRSCKVNLPFDVMQRIFIDEEETWRRDEREGPFKRQGEKGVDLECTSDMSHPFSL